MIAVLAAAAPGQADLDPVGRAIDRARTRGLDVGLHQPRRDAVALPPVGRDAARQKAQRVRGQVLHHHPGHDQEAAVADDALQLLAALAVAPAQPRVTRRKPPRRRAHRQPADHAQPAADDQIAKLRPAQRAAAQRMRRPASAHSTARFRPCRPSPVAARSHPDRQACHRTPPPAAQPTPRPATIPAAPPATPATRCAPDEPAPCGTPSPSADPDHRASQIARTPPAQADNVTARHPTQADRLPTPAQPMNKAPPSTIQSSSLSATALPCPCPAMLMGNDQV